MMRRLAVGLILVVGAWNCSSDEPPAASGVAGTGVTGVSGSPAPTGTSGAGSPGTSTNVGAVTGAGTGAAGTAAHAGTGSLAAGSGGVSGTGAIPIAGTGGSSAGTAGSSTAAAGSGGASGTGSAVAGIGGSTSVSGSGGSSAIAGSGGGESAQPKVMQACLKDPKNVVFIGDSYINYFIAHSELNGLVAERAIKDGALMQGQNYVDYAVAGTTIAAGSPAIPGQWTQAKGANKNIQVVVMDGGGNDVLINNSQCKADGAQNDATCKQVVANTLAAGMKMMTDMKASGVTEVIYFFYPHAPTGGADISDYTLPMLQSICADLSDDKFQCRVVDLVPIFEGHPDWFASDDIHANDTGEGVMADAIWKQLKEDCAAQAPSSMCCTP